MAVSKAMLYNFMQGSDISGESSWDIYKSLNPDATKEDFLTYLKGEKGADGKSAYEIWKEQDGNADKTEEDFLNSVGGVSDSDLEAIATTNKTYTDQQIAATESIIEVTLLATGWEGTAAPYSQTVEVEGIKAIHNPDLVKALAIGATEDEQKAYNKAFGFISSGNGTTQDGSVTFYTYKLPVIDITVGLKGIY